MKISINWLRDYVDISDEDIDELLKNLTIKTAELEGVEYKGKDITGLVVGQIVQLDAHPNSTKLHLLKVDVGDEILDIVCGAPNVALGAKVALVKAGGSVVGMKIKSSKVGGYMSDGMCCSEEELGIAESSEGIIILPPDSVVGSDAKKILALDDVIFEIDNKSITNRPDLWGHYGFAREVSAILGKPLRPLDCADLGAYASLPSVDISVHADNCYKYSAIRVENISVKESPLVMKTRLAYCGMRAINFLADLTNYCMLEVGQPMHAFDGELVHGINVRECGVETTFTTLDGEEKTLPSNAMVICDEHDQPVAVAGIMGGLESEITDHTHSLLLESATFRAGSIRKTAVAIGTRTDSSNRYEKSLDTHLCELATGRAIQILSAVDPDANITSSYSVITNNETTPLVIDLPKDMLHKYLGMALDDALVADILTRLQFGVDILDDRFRVTVPTFRATKDISLPADLIEEVARLYGYDRLDVQPNAMVVCPAVENTLHRDIYDVKCLLADRQYHEVQTYVWKNNEFYKELGISTTPNVRLVNSISPDSSELRDDLVMTLLQVVSENKNDDSNINIFEIGNVFCGFDSEHKVDEHTHLVMMSTARAEGELYIRLAQTIKSIVRTHKNLDVTFANVYVDSAYNHPVLTNKIYVGDTQIGHIAIISPKISSKIDKKLSIGYVCIDFGTYSALDRAVTAYSAVSKFPTTDVDLSFLVDQSITYGEIASAIKDVHYKTLQHFSHIETYENEKLGDKKSVTIRFVLGSNNKTLTNDDVKIFTDRMSMMLAKSGITLRY